MCWWAKNNVEDDTDAHEALLAADNTVIENMTKGKKSSKEKASKEKASKEKQYDDILNKYRKSSTSPQEPANENNMPTSSEPSLQASESSAQGVPVARTSSDSSFIKSKKKSSLKGSQSAPPRPPAPLSQRVNFEAESDIQKVQQGLSERKDLLQDVSEKTEELQQNSRHFRSLSKRLKDKQAQKLKKSKLPW